MPSPPPSSILSFVLSPLLITLCVYSIPYLLNLLITKSIILFFLYFFYLLVHIFIFTYIYVYFVTLHLYILQLILSAYITIQSSVYSSFVPFFNNYCHMQEKYISKDINAYNSEAYRSCHLSKRIYMFTLNFLKNRICEFNNFLPHQERLKKLFLWKDPVDNICHGACSYIRIHYVSQEIANIKLLTMSSAFQGTLNTESTSFQLSLLHVKNRKLTAVPNTQLLWSVFIFFLLFGTWVND